MGVRGAAIALKLGLLRKKRVEHSRRAVKKKNQRGLNTRKEPGQVEKGTRKKRMRRNMRVPSAGESKEEGDGANRD